MKLNIFALACTPSSASAAYLSFFNKTATRNINLSCGRNVMCSKNIMRNGRRPIDVIVSSFFFFLSRPPSNNRVTLSFLATRQRCKATAAAAQGTITGVPFVCAFCFDFCLLTNHKNVILSLMPQRRATASESADSTPSVGRRTPPMGRRTPTH